MDLRRGPSIALPPPTSGFNHGGYRRLSSSNSQTSSEFGRTSAGMAIPGTQIDDVPPALPPPRYMHCLDEGDDLAWQYQNEGLSDQAQRLAPMKAGSSLLGHSSQSPQPIRDEDDDIDMETDVAWDSGHVQNARPEAQSACQSQLADEISIPGLTSRFSSAINQGLHGETPLAKQSHHQSTHAYDKHLLSKIGKFDSPPRHLVGNPADRKPINPKLSIQTTGSTYLARPAQDSTSSLDPVTRWLPSPTSTASPNFRNTRREYSMRTQSPSTSTSHSQGVESDPVAPCSSRSRLQPTSDFRTQDTRSRSERGSCDSASFTEPENLEDEGRCPSTTIAERPRPVVYHGTKRRALSPPQEIWHDQEDEPLLSAKIPGSMSVHQSQRVGSLSSTASSYNYPSYASSSMLSNVSSLTSISTMDTPISRDSRQLFSSPQSASSPGAALLPFRKPPDATASRLAGTAPGSVEARALPTRIGNHYICACCPKKPKKFETEEQLRAHENEKQYTCAYCNNRFKNKNEAERHQNSLHLRKQSWSCAAISTYQAAFHPTAYSNPRNLTSDTCGFCGEEFTNQSPNWDERIEHLANVHKFGECNSSKKFYRADHFRQHLKHSHAGKSGKWTNVLENNCLREEAPSEVASQSPTASEHSTSGGTGRLQVSHLANPADATLGGEDTIDEE